ncbi:hypothetical protein HDU86_008479 [Geranomyces michiganensis]|nr:hypothetical protein HDU86_008479 [Geranomyces michiganensis]
MPPPPLSDHYHRGNDHQQQNYQASPLVSLTSRQLADLASCVVERLDMHDYRSAVPSSAMQAARALALTNRSDPAAALSSSTAAEAHDKIRGLLPAQLHRLAMDVEMECERRFPDLAVTVQSLQQVAGNNSLGLETLERGGRTFLSLPRKSVVPPEYLASRSTVIQMRSSSPQMGPPSVFRDVPTPLTTRHSLARSRSRNNRKGPFPSPESESLAASPPAYPVAAEPSWNINAQAPASPASYTADRHNIKPAQPAAADFSSASLPSPPFSAPASPSKLHQEPLAASRALSSASESVMDSSATASANYTHEEFVAGLATLTTSQLVAAVRDVQAVISRQQRAASTPATPSPPPPRLPLDETGELSPPPSSSSASSLSSSSSPRSDDSDSSVTHCQNLLLQLPVARVKLIWTAVAEEVRRRGLNVNNTL